MVAQRIPAPILAPSARSSSDAANTGDAARIARLTAQLAKADRLASRQRQRLDTLEEQVDALAARLSFVDLRLFRHTLHP